MIPTALSVIPNCFTSTFYSKWGALYRGALLTLGWPSRTQLLASLFFLMSHETLRIRLIRNLFAPSSGGHLATITKTLTSYKRFHCLIPDPVQRQIKTFFHYVGRNFLLPKRTQGVKPNLGSLFSKTLPLKHYFYSPAKFRQGHLLNYRRNFRLWQRDYYCKLKTSFYLGKTRPRLVRRLLTRFSAKSLLGVGLLFSLNPILLVTRVFPFFDRFLVRQLFLAGLVWVNFQQSQPKMSVLKTGDFVHIVWSPLFVRLYVHWLGRQQSYHFLMSRNLHQYYKAQRHVSFNRRKNYLRKFTWYTNLYKKTPVWLEVNYLSLSFLIISSPRKLTFSSYNFNPYLNRLLAF